MGNDYHINRLIISLEPQSGVNYGVKNQNPSTILVEGFFEV
jgi:hypothetical protein